MSCQLRIAFLAAVRAEAAYFGTRHRDFDSAIVRDLAFQFFVELAFELSDFPASHASDVNMVARAVALIKMTVAPQVKKVELVYQSLALQQIEGSVDGDTRDSRINFLGAFENFVGVEVSPGGFHNLQKNFSLPREAYSARGQFVLKPSGGFVIDAFPARNAMCRRG